MSHDFYDQLAPYYHLLYGDWRAAVDTQGAALAALLRAEGVADGAPVLDAACGIGTQTLGLVRHGFDVTASDLSPGAVERLRAELSRAGLKACVQVDDLRSLVHVQPGSMHAVLACDNSVPHLLSDAHLLECFASMHRSLRGGGVVVISVRDYASIERKSPDVRPYGLRRDEQGRRFLAVQAWEWDADQYDVRMYLTTEDADGTCSTRVLVSRYYAVTIDTLMRLMREAGFVDVRRRDDVLFQPVIVGKRPSDV